MLSDMENDQTQNNNENMGREEAERMLDVDSQAKIAAATALVTPWWYHPLLGLLGGLIIASYAIPNPFVRGGALIVYAIGAGMLVSAYKKLTGVWVSGFRRGPAGRVAIGLSILLVLIYLSTFIADAIFDIPWLFLVAGLITVLVIVWRGRAFDRALRKELSGN